MFCDVFQVQPGEGTPNRVQPARYGQRRGLRRDVEPRHDQRQHRPCSLAGDSRGRL